MNVLLSTGRSRSEQHTLVIARRARKSRVWLSFSLVSLALLLLACGSSDARLRLAAHGVGARRVQHNEAPQRPGGLVLAPGDYVLESRQMRVVVGGLEREGSARGAILEVALHGAPAEDSLVLWAPTLYVNDRLQPMVTGEISFLDRTDRAGLRVTATTSFRGRVIDVSRDLVIGGRGVTLYQTTHVTPRDGLPLTDVRVGGRIRWGGATPFVPSNGPLSDDAWHEAAWVGVEGIASSTVLSIDDDPLRVRSLYEAHGVSRFLKHTEMAAPAHDIAEGESLADRRILTTARGGLAAAIRTLGWARGTPYPEVLVTLPYAPTGSSIRIYTQDGRPVMSARPDAHGQAIVPFPPLGRAAVHTPRYYAVGSAFGHARSDSVPVTVEPGARALVRIPTGGQIRIVARDPNGQPVAARARVIGVARTATLDLGPDWSAAGAGDTVLLTEGLAVVPAEPGRYRVIVSHGPEWTLHDETVEVSATYRPEVRAILQHVIDPGEWVASDFHVHSAPSYDSRVSLEDRLTCFAAEGVRFAAATDHNYVTAYGPTAEEVGISDFGSVTGVEVTTESPSFGHFNAFPFPLDPSLPFNGAPRFSDTSPSALFMELHARDPETLVQVNHPRLEGGIGYFDVMGFDPETGAAEGPYSDSFDTLEVWNGFDLGRLPKFERVFGEWLELLALGHRYIATGNSDSHLVRLQLVGYPRTYVNVPGGRIDDGLAVVRALREGRAFVTSGPFLEVSVDGHGPGEIAEARGRVAHVRVIVRAAPWLSADDLTLFINGEAVKTLAIGPAAPAVTRGRTAPPGRPLPVLRFDRVVDVPVSSDAFLVVQVRGRTSMGDLLGRSGALPIAFTNPIWLDHDGDGTVTLAPSRR